MVGPPISIRNHLCHQHVPLVSPQDEDIVQQGPLTRPRMHPGGLLSLRQAEECVRQDEKVPFAGNENSRLSERADSPYQSDEWDSGKEDKEKKKKKKKEEEEEEEEEGGRDRESVVVGRMVLPKKTRETGMAISGLLTAVIQSYLTTKRGTPEAQTRDLLGTFSSPLPLAVVSSTTLNRATQLCQALSNSTMGHGFGEMEERPELACCAYDIVVSLWPLAIVQMEHLLQDADASFHPISGVHSTVRGNAHTDTLTWFSPQAEAVSWAWPLGRALLRGATALPMELHLEDDEAVIRPAISVTDCLVHQHVLSISPANEEIIQQLCSSKSLSMGTRRVNS
nr:unnamed protein product [Spirometra erinaceieuropaei]